MLGTDDIYSRPSSHAASRRLMVSAGVLQRAASCGKSAFFPFEQGGEPA